MRGIEARVCDHAFDKAWRVMTTYDARAVNTCVESVKPTPRDACVFASNLHTKALSACAEKDFLIRYLTRMRSVGVGAHRVLRRPALARQAHRHRRSRRIRDADGDRRLQVQARRGDAARRRRA